MADNGLAFVMDAAWNIMSLPFDLYGVHLTLQQVFAFGISVLVTLWGLERFFR